jgi:hypothetical protein
MQESHKAKLQCEKRRVPKVDNLKNLKSHSLYRLWDFLFGSLLEFMPVASEQGGKPCLLCFRPLKIQV